MNMEDLYSFHNGNISAMAREVGVSRQGLHKRLKKLGLKGTGTRLNKACTDLIERGEMPISKMAKEIGFSSNTVAKYAKKIKGMRKKFELPNAPSEY